MNKLILFALAALATLTLTGCYGTYYGGARVYGGGPSYGGGYYDSDPVFIQRDYVYISGRPYYVPVYRHRDRIYYTYGGHNHYFNDYECQKYRNHNHSHSHNSNYDDYRRQDRYQYEQQRRQYEYQQRDQRDRSEHRKSSNKSQQELAKQQLENRRKQQEQYNAQWKAQHEYPRQDDKKKKKKNDD